MLFELVGKIFLLFGVKINEIFLIILFRNVFLREKKGWVFSEERWEKLWLLGDIGSRLYKVEEVFILDLSVLLFRIVDIMDILN